MNRILVITDGESDLLQLLRECCPVTVVPPRAVRLDTEGYDAACVLGGYADAPLRLPAPIQAALLAMQAEGKPLFYEFVAAIGGMGGGTPEATERRRAVYRPSALPCSLADGALFDGRSNDCIPYNNRNEAAVPILTYGDFVCAHTHTQEAPEGHAEGTWALFFGNDTTLVSAIRLLNFRRARFAPARHWEALITGILSFLAGEAVTPTMPPPVLSYEAATVQSAADAAPAIRRGISWIHRAHILRDGGRGGAHEGYYHRISAKNGKQEWNPSVRADCTGEVGGALLFDSLLSGNRRESEEAHALFSYIFDWLTVKEGAHRGMIRWHETAWEICFQDDVARAVLPLLLSGHFGGEIPHFAAICEALDYMLNTTGEDGIRTACTRIGMKEEELAALKKAGSGSPCAHFNAYYHAALLLAYRAGGREEYLTCAERGLATLMARYPETRRETSETEEACRLIFPLAVLYGVTGKEEHYAWLVRVSEDLEARRHPSGGYAEWDTGYRAHCSRNHKGECALLAENGDPVADLLYSNNWLPLGFAYAYLVTGEARFHTLWCRIASFLLSAQIVSEDEALDGAWARAFDMEAWENYGMPHDIGWGPSCIESGWTVGEILMGLLWMQLAERTVGLPTEKKES